MTLSARAGFMSPDVIFMGDILQIADLRVRFACSCTGTCCCSLSTAKVLLIGPGPPDFPFNHLPLYTVCKVFGSKNASLYPYDPSKDPIGKETLQQFSSLAKDVELYPIDDL